MLNVPQFVLSVHRSAKQFGLSFTFVAPTIYNDMPDDVPFAINLFSIGKKLKYYLFAKFIPILV